MIAAFFRVLFGYILACLAAGLTQVLFVVTPFDLAQLNTFELSDRLPTLGTLALLTATHAGIFASVFALLTIIVGEWQRICGSHYYALAGLAIAGAGFFAQYSSEAAGEATIFNPYALAAFLASGVVGGIVYWLFAGRYAGGRRRENEFQSPREPGPRPTAKDESDGDEKLGGEVRIRRVQAADVKTDAKPDSKPGVSADRPTPPSTASRLASVPGIKPGPRNGRNGGSVDD